MLFLRNVTFLTTDPRLTFQRVGDAEQRASRLHLDVTADDRQAAVQRLCALGAHERQSVTEHPRDLDEVIRRLQAYSAAGADVLFAPGVVDLDELRRLIGEVDRPVNVLAYGTYGYWATAGPGAGAARNAFRS